MGNVKCPYYSDMPPGPPKYMVHWTRVFHKVDDISNIGISVFTAWKQKINQQQNDMYWLEDL